MNRETKAGLVVTASFIGLLSAVVIKKYMEPAALPKEGSAGVVVASAEKSVKPEGQVTPITTAGMDLVPVPRNEIKLTTGEEVKGSGVIPPLPGAPLIPEAPVKNIEGSVPVFVPPASGGSEIPPLPNAPVPSVGGLPPLPSAPVPSVGGLPPLPSAPEPSVGGLPPLPSAPEPSVGGLPPLPSAPVPSAPVPNVGGLPPLGGSSIPVVPSAGIITAPPPPPAASGFGSSSSPVLNTTSPMPPLRTGNAIPFNASEGPARRTEFIPGEVNRVAPVNTMPLGNTVPVNGAAGVIAPQRPLGANEIISVPIENGTAPFTPSSGAVLTIPTNESRPIMPVPPPGTVTTASNQFLAPVAPVASVLASPRVDTWTEQSYVCKPGETYTSISQKIYGTAEYAKALQMWNENHPRARVDAPKSGLLLPGQDIYYPPTAELSRRYGNFMPKITPASATGTNAQNSIQPLGAIPPLGGIQRAN